MNKLNTLSLITLLAFFNACGSDNKESTGGDIPPAEQAEPSFIDLPINPVFSRVNANIVKEEQSNLYWQDNVAAKTTIEKFAEAESYCASLTLNDISSWRLPTYFELLTLVNYERHSPSIYDTFSNTNDQEYWTQTQRAANRTPSHWTIDFERGSSYTWSALSWNVRCVSDEFANKRLKERDLRKNGDIVTDHIHNLLWQDALSTKVEKYSFAEADAYCDNLSLGGLNSGWRVPTVKELASLIKIEAYDAAIDANVTSVAYSDAYWTSNSDASGNTYQWDINFKDGVIHRGGTTHASFDQYVRCVRNAN